MLLYLQTFQLCISQHPDFVKEMFLPGIELDHMNAKQDFIHHLAISLNFQVNSTCINCQISLRSNYIVS